MGAAHAATWANFHFQFWGPPAMQIVHRTSYGRDLGFICISGGFHCMLWVPAALLTQAWSYCRCVSVQQQHSPIPAAHRSGWLLSSTFFNQPVSSWGHPLGLWLLVPPQKSVLEDKKLPDFSHLLWKLGNRAAHSWAAAILTNPLGLLCMKRDWDNPERMKEPKMVLIYFPVCCVFTKQGLGSASKPNCCFSIRAFIEASEWRDTYSCGVMSEFLQNHVICACVQPCILFLGWIFFFFLS